MKIIYTDVLVIGGGLAGLRAAIGVKKTRQGCHRAELNTAKAIPLRRRAGWDAGQPRQFRDGGG